MRILLFTGKGGVGKTTVASATALLTAERGYKTLALSTDSAHSLSDALEQPLSGKPQPVAPNLWGQETELSQALETQWGTIRKWVASLLAWRGMEEIAAQEMAILPGMEELANLIYILDYAEKKEYEVIVVDCAPTGETLRLLSFPEVMRWWMEKLFPLERQATRILRPMLRTFTDIPLPDDQVFKSIQEFFHKLHRMRQLLTDPTIASVRLVVNAEKMVIKEAQRTFTYLSLYGYATDLIICNRLLPQEGVSPYFDSWKLSQGKHFQTIKEIFSPLPIRTIPFFPQEVAGILRLREMAQALYGDEDPVQVFFTGHPQHLEREDGQYTLTLTLPFTSKENIEVWQRQDELIVQVGGYRRNVLLPQSLAGHSVREARWEDGKLKLFLEKRRD